MPQLTSEQIKEIIERQGELFVLELKKNDNLPATSEDIEKLEQIIKEGNETVIELLRIMKEAFGEVETLKSEREELNQQLSKNEEELQKTNSSLQTLSNEFDNLKTQAEYWKRANEQLVEGKNDPENVEELKKEVSRVITIKKYNE